MKGLGKTERPGAEGTRRPAQAGAGRHDQRRTMAPKPLKAAHDILREMQDAAPSSLEAP